MQSHFQLSLTVCFSVVKSHFSSNFVQFLGHFLLAHLQKLLTLLSHTSPSNFQSVRVLQHTNSFVLLSPNPHHSTLLEKKV